MTARSPPATPGRSASSGRSSQARPWRTACSSSPFDEAHGDTANHIATIVVAPRLAAPVASAKQYGHPSLLRTIEQLYGLPCLADACKAEPMIDLLPPASARPGGRPAAPARPPRRA